MSYSGEAQDAKGQKFLTYGKISVDVEKLEEQLTTRLIRSSSRDEKFQAVNKTFEEVIRQDRPFGGLLMKIKNAYQEFLQTLSEGKANESQEQILESNGVSNQENSEFNRLCSLQTTLQETQQALEKHKSTETRLDQELKASK